MKKYLLRTMLLVSVFAIFTIGGNPLQAGSKCRYEMVCGGNANIKANVCTTDCNDSSKKEKAKEWFKKQCSSASKPSQYKSGWKDCDAEI